MKDSPKKTDLKTLMNSRVINACLNKHVRPEVLADYTYTFQKIGLGNGDAQELANQILEMLSDNVDLQTKENEIHQFLKAKEVTINNSAEKLGFLGAVQRIRSNRAEKILSQIESYLSDVTGKIIDFGAGDGRLAQTIADKLGKQVSGVEVAEYKPIPGQTVDISLFDGRTVNADPAAFEAGICINVLHHDPDNEKILDELARIVKKRLVIIETVPEGATPAVIEQDKERVFMNDYLSNRIIHGALCGADIPVPGTYDTPDNWAERLDKKGFKVTQSIDLGYDQPTIKDRHHLIVAERTEPIMR